MAAGIKLGLALLAAALLQATLLSPGHVLGGTPDLLLVTLVVLALLHGAIPGAVAGFGAGLVLDVLYLQPLGVTSLLYALAGFWVGRYGETTGRDRTHAPYLAVAVVTVLYALGAYTLRFVLGESVTAASVLVGYVPATVALNLALAVPTVALARRRLAPARPAERSVEVQLLG